MKRLFALFLTVLTFCLFFLGSESVIADADYASGVAIDAEHFPDESFRQIVARYDQTADGVLSPEELGSITEISLFWASVNSLQGIEYFINLTSLDCSGAKVSPFDLSCLPNLKYLNCPYNGWEYLDIRGCLALEELHCEGNRLQALIVSGAPSLRVLNCQGNLLQELDVSGCVSLEQLDCSCNNLYSLDLNGCSSLLALNCSANHLSSIDLSQAGCLQLLCCNFNQLSALNVSCCPGLVTVDCIGNNMSQLILGNQSALKNIFCGFNALTSLELSSCPNLEKMNCCYNQIDSLDISACPILTSTVSSPGSVEYRLSPSVVTYSVGAVDASYDYSLDSDPEKKLTLDTRVQLTPSLYRPIAEATCPLVSSDPEDWGMPSVALDYWHILTVRAQGAERLNYMDTTASNDYPSRYYLYDIDKDGSPELIVEGSGAEAIRQGYVFTGNQGHAVYLGAIHMGHTSLCTFPEGNGILCYNAHMGSMSIRKISLNNGQLMSEEVIPLTDGYMSSFDYPSVSTLVPGAANLAYYCKATNPILFRTWQGIVQWLETQEDYDYPNVSWPKDNEQFYSDIISSNGFFILRGVINRMQYTPYISFSSLLDYNVRTYFGSDPIAHYSLSPRDMLYDDFNDDGIMDCLVLLSDTEGNISIPCVLSYSDHTAYAYVQEDLASQICNIRVGASSNLEYETRWYSEAEPVWAPVKLLFCKDYFLCVHS